MLGVPFCLQSKESYFCEGLLVFLASTTVHYAKFGCTINEDKVTRGLQGEHIARACAGGSPLRRIVRVAVRGRAARREVASRKAPRANQFPGGTHPAAARPCRASASSCCSWCSWAEPRLSSP